MREEPANGPSNGYVNQPVASSFIASIASLFLFEVIAHVWSNGG
ncbi:hypothetical protein NQ117_15800 [Paenibacillus sp. SC116]|nr:hypothetical protein [Paenibacillus sp. SC116]